MIVGDGQLFFLRVIHTKTNRPDVGVYYCRATNIHGSVASANATVKIAGKFHKKSIVGKMYNATFKKLVVP